MMTERRRSESEWKCDQELPVIASRCCSRRGRSDTAPPSAPDYPKARPSLLNQGNTAEFSCNSGANSTSSTGNPASSDNYRRPPLHSQLLRVTRVANRQRSTLSSEASGSAYQAVVKQVLPVTLRSRSLRGFFRRFFRRWPAVAVLRAPVVPPPPATCSDQKSRQILSKR